MCGFLMATTLYLAGSPSGLTYLPMCHRSIKLDPLYMHVKCAPAGSLSMVEGIVDGKRVRCIYKTSARESIQCLGGKPKT